MDDVERATASTAIESEPECYFVSPPKLKRLASQEMVLVLYRHMVHNRAEDEILCADWFCKHIRETKDIIEVLPVIGAMIDDCFCEPVYLSIEQWCDHHAQYVFFDGSLHDGILNCIDEFVLKLDGSIDFIRTAQNVLNGDKLNNVEKYRLACVTCLREHIDDLWLLVRDNPRAVDCDPEKNPLVHYWTGRMRREPPRWTIVVDKPLAWAPYCMYFWHMFLENDQIIIANELLKRGNIFQIEHVLLKLSKTQLRRVLQYAVFEMFKSLADATCKHLDSIMRIWNYVKYFISPDMFLEIIISLVDEELLIGCSTNICPLLFQMWISALDVLKQRVLYDLDGLEDIFDLLSVENRRTLEIKSRDCNFDMKLCMTILTELEPEYRYALWCRVWHHFIVRTPVRNLNNVMKLCFNDDQLIAQSKETYMMDFAKIKGFCKIMIAEGCIQRLDEYLNFCSSNTSFVACVKRQILTWLMTKPKSLLFQLNEASLVQLDVFIDSAFYDRDDAVHYKKKLFKACQIVRTIHSRVVENNLGLNWE